VGRHHYGNRDDVDETSRTVASVLNEDQKKKVHWVEHRLVRPHPRTGVKSLYAVSGSSFGIVGMEDGPALALLDELKAHATQDEVPPVHELHGGRRDRLGHNAQLLHAAPLTHLDEARTLWRVTVKEDPA
jgi:taurine dioxygenase